MATRANSYVPVDEYFEREANSVDRHEYLNGQISLMAGGTLEHSAIAANVSAALVSQLADTDCVVRGCAARLRTSPTGLYSYADAVVSCGPEESENNTLLNPVLIVEVLSEGTESYDRGQKFELYRQIQSFREYLVIAQDRVYVEHHRRDESIHTQWTMRVFTNSEDIIPLSAVPAVANGGYLPQGAGRSLVESFGLDLGGLPDGLFLPILPHPRFPALAGCRIAVTEAQGSDIGIGDVYARAAIRG
jgi:Uma2 family endonuclease